jgi:hypothetical protein
MTTIHRPTSYLREREREKRKLGGVVRDTTVLEGGVIETEFGSLEGSKAVPASPSEISTQLYRFVRISQETHHVSATSPTG